LSLLHVPHLYVLRAYTGDSFAVGAEADASDRLGLPLEDEDLLPLLRVPDPNRLIRAGAGDSFAVGAEADAPHHVGMPFDGENLGPLLRVPHLLLAWNWCIFWPRHYPTTRDDAFAVGAEAGARDLTGMPLEGDRFRSFGPRRSPFQPGEH